MKKIVLTALIISSFTFASGMRFTMERNRKVQERQENVEAENTNNNESSDAPAPLRNYEMGDSNIRSTKEKVNTDLKLTGSRSNKYAALNNALNKLVKESNTYLGIPYVWGGNTRRGLDCSAFVKNVYSSIGVVLPRVSRDQAKVGRSVSLAAARKGDLIFFETDPKRPSTVSHVGMYIGNGKMIHASSGSEKVVIVPLNQGYFMSKVVVIKRIVDVS